MSGRVLRTDVDYVIVVGEEFALCGYELAVAVEVVLNGIVRLGVRPRVCTGCSRDSCRSPS